MGGLGFLAAVVSAALSSAATLVQARGARGGRAAGALVYAAGLTLDLLGWVMSAVALRYLPVFAVQSITASQVALTVVGAHLLGTTRARPGHLVAALLSAAALGVLAAGGQTGGSAAAPDVVDYVIVVGGAALLVATPFALRPRGALARATIAGLAFGGVPVAVRALHERPAGIADLLHQPAAYAIPVLAGLGAVMFALALRRGSPGSVAAVVVGIEVLAPGLLGMALLGDTLRPGWALPTALAAAVALTTLVVLGRAQDNANKRDHPPLGLVEQHPTTP
ncbi:hypothetical protein [Actinokineospora bangkokensis]|uniref:EamA domain-containing protein n=1 Tax=Actinokineospora bangkokensis TaxID=1193682 RepID=A0A1Q9LMT6_9PSEU|nr:hypothetical protein [Actinokineospora bangkokensis]OLR93357.1 hypothetical protein BJP25_17985 [Actinokineospora bangkokensis]